MKHTTITKCMMLAIAVCISFFAYANRHRMLQIFQNGYEVQRLRVSDIDYIEINEIAEGPENFQAVLQDDGTVLLTWQAEPDAKYEITRLSSELTLLADKVTGDSYVDSEPPKGCYFSYMIRAIYDDGLVSDYAWSSGILIGKEVLWSSLNEDISYCDWTFENYNKPEEIDAIWNWKGYNDKYYLSASAYYYGEYASEAIAVSPIVDLTNVWEASLSFETAAKFQTNLRELCRLLVRVEGEEAWTPVNLQQWPDAGVWTFVNAGKYDLSNYVGRRVQFGFKYGSTDNGADTWEIRNFTITRESSEYVLEHNPIYNPNNKDSDWNVYYLMLSDEKKSEMQNCGAVLTDWGPNNADRHLYIWDGTFTQGSADEDAISLIVTNVGWSGAGFNVSSPGVDMSALTDDTRFHLEYRSEGKIPDSIALILMDLNGNYGRSAKVAIGEDFKDGGAIYPSIANGATSQWQTIDISLGELKKIYPSFEYEALPGREGNIFSFLAGGVPDTSIDFKNIYFYNGGVQQPSATVVATNSTHGKKILSESFLGSSCGFCPRAHAGYNHLMSTYPDEVVVMNYHTFNSYDYITKEKPEVPFDVTVCPQSIFDRSSDNWDQLVNNNGDGLVDEDGSLKLDKYFLSLDRTNYCDVSLKVTKDWNSYSVSGTIKPVKEDFIGTVFVQYVLLGDGFNITQKNYYSGNESMRGFPGMDYYIDGPTVIADIADNVVLAQSIITVYGLMGLDRTINIEPAKFNMPESYVADNYTMTGFKFGIIVTDESGRVLNSLICQP